MKARVLIIEDEQEIGELISIYIKKEGIECLLVETAEEGLKQLESLTYELIVLDLNLPGIDGFEALGKIRKITKAPVIIVSARKSDEDKILGLGLGADDFVTKPFSPKVLIARIRANLRRMNELEQVRKDGIVEFGDYYLDIEGYLLKHKGTRIPIPPREFDLLVFLVTNAGTTMTPEDIYRMVWGNKYGDVSTVAVHVQRLRKRIEGSSAEPRFIQTVHGFGYRFNEELINKN